MESSIGKGSGPKGGAKDDTKFVQPQPITTPRKDKLSELESVSESENSTAVSGNLTGTDDSVQPSRYITSAEEVMGSQSECVTEEESLFSSPSQGSISQWERDSAFLSADDNWARPCAWCKSLRKNRIDTVSLISHSHQTGSGRDIERQNCQVLKSIEIKVTVYLIA